MAQVPDAIVITNRRHVMIKRQSFVPVFAVLGIFITISLILSDWDHSRPQFTRAGAGENLFLS